MTLTQCLYITQASSQCLLRGEEASVTCGRGAKIVGTAGVVHREKTSGYSAIIGFAVAPETLTQPINKPLPVTI